MTAAWMGRILERYGQTAVLEGPEGVKAIRRESQDFICSKYNWDDVTAQTLKLYTAQKDEGVGRE